MTISLQTRFLLENHIAQKSCNRSAWLEKAIDGNDPTAFPYSLDKKKCGTLQRAHCIPIGSTAPVFVKEEGSMPSYLVAMPSFGENVHVKYKRIIETFLNESHGLDTHSSAAFATSRLALVVGFNRFRSIDNETNINFCNEVMILPAITRVAAQAFGFLWDPHWGLKDIPPMNYYNLRTAFLILKLLAPAVANAVCASNENSLGECVPYQQIREYIKDYTVALRLPDLLQQARIKAPLYFTSFDDDFISTRSSEGFGLFSYYDAIFLKYATPHVMTTGYSASQQESELIQWGVILDMAIRQAMASVFPNAPYYPEPNFLTLINGSQALARLSYIGKGDGLESRRFIKSGIESGQLDVNKFVFLALDTLKTTLVRMRTPKSIKFKTISKVNICTSDVLGGLRGIPQTHAKPKQWADQLYLALNVKASKVTDITKHLMTIYQLFNPWDRSRAVTTQKYSSKLFLSMVESHTAWGNHLQGIPLPIKQEEIESLAVAMVRAVYPHLLNQQSELMAMYAQCSAAISLLFEAQESLLVKNVDLTLLRRIIQAAFLSGNAFNTVINDILKS